MIVMRVGLRGKIASGKLPPLPQLNSAPGPSRTPPICVSSIALTFRAPCAPPPECVSRSSKIRAL